MTRLSLATTAAAALLALSLPAAAATFHVDFVNASPSVTVNGSVNAQAGAINVKVKSTEANAPDDLRGNSFVAWCLDIGATMKSWDYSVTAAPFGDHDLSGVMGTIQKLFNTAYSVASTGTAAQSAGFQLALWEIITETSGSYDLSAGVFKITNAAGAVAAANGFLGGLNNSTNDYYKLTYLEAAPGANKSQHLVTAVAAPAPVPLPAAGVLLFGALGGLGMVARRRKSTDA